ncbi:hypothetical protein BH20ACI2_BH20ACI2_15140 [soil metagenome]
MKKVLLDENLPRQLAGFFSSKVSVTSVPDLGWQSKKNGELLSAMESEGIEILITADRNLRFQQNLKKFSVLVVVIKTFDVRLKALAGSVSKIEKVILENNGEEQVIEVDLLQEDPFQ